MSNLIVCRSLRMSSLFLVALLLTLAGSRAVRADNFSAGQFTTYGQSDWGLIPTATNVLDDNFAVVYASQGAVLVVGDTANFDLVFTSTLNLENYMPAIGNPGTLIGSRLNPTQTSSGAFGGAVVALSLDVDFSAAGVLAHPAGISFGDLYLTGYDGTSLAGLDGMTVSQLLAIDNRALGDGISDFSIDDLYLVSNPLGAAFSDGQISNFSRDHLTATNPNGDVNPIVTPEPSSLLLLWVGLLAVAMLHYWWHR